jgi:serine protease Do
MSRSSAALRSPPSRRTTKTRSWPAATPASARGFVSNERFSLEEDGDESYIQHTAPIDPGSSGGPLTTPEGKLLGVNTLKIRGRENVGLAVPASVVKDAVERVVDQARAPERTADQQALAACEAFLARAAAGEPGLAALERSLGAPLVAELGVPSLPALPPPNDKWIAGFIDDPTTVFLRAIALRLTRGAAGTSCTLIEGDSRSASFKAKLAGAERALTFAPEQGRWKLTKVDLGAKGGRSFLDGAPPVTPKKWKPSLR